MKTLQIIFIGVIALLAASCSSSQITSSWKNESSTPGKYKKILVMALLNESDRTLREKMEQHLVDDLKERGMDAISSYKQYGPKAFDNMNESEAVEKIRDSGVDAVITIVLLDRSKERNYVPGQVSYTPYAVYYNRWWGYYSTLNRRVYSRGYYVTNTEYFWESNLYDAASKELIYSVQTKSFDPASTESLAHEYGKMIVSDMVKNSVL
ncbi:MAG: hypothetical protein JJE09_16435 [Bacteroidia bacterium]|nr:hypothetical protein [Bacteroidia bacterium]